MTNEKTLQDAIDLLYECRDALAQDTKHDELYRKVWHWCQQNRNATSADEPRGESIVQRIYTASCSDHALKKQDGCKVCDVIHGPMAVMREPCAHADTTTLYGFNLNDGGKLEWCPRCGGINDDGEWIAVRT